MSPWLSRAAIALACCSALGCGSGLAPVKGTLTLDGEAVRAEEGVQAMVVFQPDGGAGSVGTALVDGSGGYKIRTGNVVGVEPGAYRVSVNVIEKTPSADPHAPPSRRRLSPARYANASTSGLRYEVPSGGARIDIDLLSSQ